MKQLVFLIVRYLILQPIFGNPTEKKEDDNEAG